MKNLISAFCLLIVLIGPSCNTDDPPEADGDQDPIIGSWLLIRVFDLDANGNINSQENYELNCIRPTIIILRTDGSLDGTGDCFEAGVIYEGTWLKLNEGFYRIQSTTIPPDGDTRPLFDDDLQVTFSENLMQWAFEEKSEEIIYFEFRKQ